MRGRPRGATVVLLLALCGSACAGEVGKYRNAAPGTSAVTPGASRGGSTALASEAGPAVGRGQAGAVSASPGASSSAGPAPATTSSGAAGRAILGATPGPRIGSGTARPLSGPAAPTPAAAAVGPAGGSTGGAIGPDGTPPPSTPTTASVAGGGTTTGVTKDAITVGLFYPKTGAYTGIGRNAPLVAQTAFDEAGLINGRRLVLKTYDDGTANASTIQVEEKRAKDEAFVLMSVVSESNVVLAPLANQHKIPIVVGNIDEKVALPLTYAFPVYAYWARQASILPSFIKNVLGGGAKKIGIVYEGTSTATDAKNVFKDKARDLGLNVVFEQPIAMNQSTCANEVSNLEAHGVEVVYMMNGPLGGICMLRDAGALGYHPTWTGVGISWNFNVVAAASGGGADGIRTLATATTLETPAGRHFAEVMRKAAPNSGADTDDIMLIFYSLIQSTLEGLRRTGPNPTREGFVQTMETKMSGYDSGYLPPPSFGPGNRSGPVVVGVSECCNNGRWFTPQAGWRAGF